MSKLLRSLCFVFFLSMPALLVPALVSAQPWTTVFSGTATITAVKFLDKEGAPTNGFVGYPGGISYTLNTGGTWTTATTPSFTGTVTDFTFLNSQVGAAGVINNGTQTGLLLTFDGGLTWKFDANAPNEINGVYFHKSDHKLFIASATDSAAFSVDTGGTFTRFSDFPYTGFAFNSDAKGVLADVGGNLGNNHSYLLTNDGGKTWLKTQMFADGWQPVGLAQTNTYFVTDPYNSKQMYRTDNGGQVWTTVPGFTSSFPTGSMAGDVCGLVATAGDGVWVSIDGGIGWQPIPMGPLSTPLTRFYVTSTTIFAAEGKNLESHALPAPLPIHLFPPVLNYTTAGCFTADTVAYFYTCACSSFQLTGYTLSGPGGSAAPSTFAVSPGPLPRPTCGLDSIHVQYTPTSSSPDTLLVALHFMENGSPVDTTLFVYGPGQPINVTADTRHLVVYNRKGCEDIDTSITLTNNLCNELSIQSISIDDPTIVQVLNGAVPITLSARSSYRLPIHMRGIAEGTYNAEITIVVTTPTGEKTLYVFVTLLVSRGVTPQVSKLQWTVPSLCLQHDTTITYRNNLCDSISITNVFLSKGSASDFVIGGPKVIRLGPGDSYTYTVHIIPTTAGTYTDRLTFQASIDGTTIDYVDTLSFTIQRDIQIQAQATPNGAVFGAASLCDSTRVISIILKNTQCVPLQLSSVNYFLPKDSTYRIGSNVALGRTLQPGEQDSIVVHFFPKEYVSGDQGSIQITYKYGSTTKTVLLPVSGFGSSKVTASLDLSALSFGTLKFCDTKQLSTTLHNGPCSAIVISSINVLSGSGFTITSPTQGMQIPAGGSVPVTVNFIPTAPGNISGKIEIVISDPTGNTGVSDTMSFDAVVTAPIRNFSVGGIAGDPLPACQFRDDTITLANHGECDTIVITAATASSGSVTVTPQYALTHKLAVGDSMRFVVHFAPNNVVAPLVGDIVIAASPDITIPYNIPVTSCGTHTPGKLTANIPDSIFNTKNCTILSRSYAIGASDTDGIVIQSVTIPSPPASKFLLTFVGAPKFPVTLHKGDSLLFTIDYNPDAVGSDQASLVIVSPTNGFGTRTIPLTGSATGAPSNARLGITGPSNQTNLTIPPDLTSATDFPLIIRDPIAAAIGLTSAHFFVNYNRDVLTEKSVNAAAGWSVTSATEQAGGLDVQMTYSGGGAVAAGTQIATISMFVSLADSSSTAITISQTHFNQSDPNFERCKLSLSSAGEAVTVNVAMGCNDSIMQRALRGQPIISAFSIRPNPIRKTAASIEVDFGVLVKATTTVELIDMSGKRVQSFANRDIGPGSYAITVPTTNLAEGMYFVQLTANNQVVTRKIMVVRE